MVYTLRIRIFPPEIKDRIRARTLTFLDETDDIVSYRAMVLPKRF